MAKSIRVRLQLWYAVVLTAVVSGFAGILYYEVHSARLAELDNDLETTAAGLDSALRLFPLHELNGEPPPKPPPKKFGPPKGGEFGPPKGGEFGPGPKSRDHLLAGLDLPGPPSERPKDMYFAVWRADGSLLKSFGLPADRHAPNVVRAKPVAAFSGQNRELVTNGPEATVILVGRPASDVTSGLTTFTWQLAATGIAVLAVGLAGGWWISRRLLKPIASIAETASRISVNNLSERIDTKHVESELADLAGILNGTFERLESAFDRQAQFTADASHELRTPLAVIRSQAELALSRPREAREYQEALRACLRATTRMTDLVEGLLTLARTDAGMSGTSRERLDLGRIAADATELCRSLADEKQVRLATELHSVHVIGDPEALSRVVANLVVNAIQYNRPDGEVHLTVASEGAEAILSVRDTGPGIPPEHQEQLFERFYRADKARSRETGGSGLGLAIAKTIVESHGGSIGFTSDPGKGSTFWVRLPLAGGSEVPTKKASGRIRAAVTPQS
jgi:two-component system, OmpR family, sensor kinase